MEPASLSQLREVDGVLGSFVVDGGGNLLARDLPPLFDAETMSRGARHLSRLRAALQSDGSAFESCVARFGPHRVLLRAAQQNTLCVLLPHGSNLAAVQMSATLIARRLSIPSPAAREESPPSDADAEHARSFAAGDSDAGA